MSETDGRPRGRAIAAGLCLALSTFGPAAARAAVSILPLGDSITEGTAEHPFSGDDYPESAYRNDAGGPPANLGSYREHLHDLLTHESCGAEIEWVGTRRANGRLPSVHQGHGGWHASYFDAVEWRDANGVHEGERNLAGWLPILAPDIVTLHLGTNGLGRARSASQNTDDIEGILDDIFAADPATRVYLANLIPIAGWWGDRATSLPESRPTVREEAQVLSGLLGNLAAEQAAAGRAVTLVDVNSEFYLDESNPVDCPAATGGDPNNMAMTVCVPHPDGEGTIPDGLHPGLRGDRFIAERFFAAMRATGGVCAGDDPMTDPALPIDTETPPESGPPEPEPLDAADRMPPPVDPSPPPVDLDDGTNDNPEPLPDEGSTSDERRLERLVSLLRNWRHGGRVR